MGMYRMASVAAILLGVAWPAMAADGFVLVADGKAQCPIVLREGAGEAEQFAAEELRSHLNQMSGSEFQVTTAPVGSVETPGIFVGTGQVARKGFERKTETALDGFLIRSDDTSLVICGDNDRGTLYGVYTYLESLGCRWWTPTESTIPKMASITAKGIQVRQTPRLEYRDMMYQESWDGDGKLWYVRNKLNGFAWSDPPAKFGGRYKFIGNLVHSYVTLLKASGEPITEEMWALRDGKRKPNTQPCLSSDKVFDAMVKGAIALYRKTPDARFIVVGQEDNKSYCQCEKCAATDAAEESHSGQVIAFANRVAEALEKEIPGAKVCTPAYEWSRKPPKTIKPRENVYITLCTIECDFAHPLATATNEVNAAFREDIQNWNKIAQRFYVWDYVTNYRHHLAPFPNLEAVVPNIKFLADNGARGIFEQGAHKARGSEFVGLRMWVMAQALWNPEADGKALVREFCDGYYGAASPAIQKYIDVIHAPAREQDFVMRIYRLLDAPYMAPAVMAGAEAALREAEQAAKGDPVLERRVRHAHMPVWYVLAKRGPASPTWKAVEEKVGKLDIKAVAEGFAKVAEEYQVNAISDGEVLKPWLDWLGAYASQVAEKGVPVPPELVGKDPATYHLIQGCQFDGRGRWYAPAEGASDGWGVRQPTVGWTATCALATPDHYQPGKKYRMFVRARSVLKAGASGRAWQCGVWRAKDGKAPAGAKVDVSTMSDGAWHVVDLGEFVPVEGDMFYFANEPNAAEEVVIDCIWLEQVAGE